MKKDKKIKEASMTTGISGHMGHDDPASKKNKKVMKRNKQKLFENEREDGFARLRDERLAGRYKGQDKNFSAFQKPIPQAGEVDPKQRRISPKKEKDQLKDQLPAFARKKLDFEDILRHLEQQGIDFDSLKPAQQRALQALVGKDPRSAADSMIATDEDYKTLISPELRRTKGAARDRGTKEGGKIVDKVSEFMPLISQEAEDLIKSKRFFGEKPKSKSFYVRNFLLSYITSFPLNLQQAAEKIISQQGHRELKLTGGTQHRDLVWRLFSSGEDVPIDLRKGFVDHFFDPRNVEDVLRQNKSEQSVRAGASSKGVKGALVGTAGRDYSGETSTRIATTDAEADRDDYGFEFGEDRGEGAGAGEDEGGEGFLSDYEVEEGPSIEDRNDESDEPLSPEKIADQLMSKMGYYANTEEDDDEAASLEITPDEEKSKETAKEMEQLHSAILKDQEDLMSIHKELKRVSPRKRGDHPLNEKARRINERMKTNIEEYDRLANLQKSKEKEAALLRKAQKVSDPKDVFDEVDLFKKYSSDEIKSIIAPRVFNKQMISRTARLVAEEITDTWGKAESRVFAQDPLYRHYLENLKAKMASGFGSRSALESELRAIEKKLQPIDGVRNNPELEAQVEKLKSRAEKIEASLENFEKHEHKLNLIKRQAQEDYQEIAADLVRVGFDKFKKNLLPPQGLSLQGIEKEIYERIYSKLNLDDIIRKDPALVVDFVRDRVGTEEGKRGKAVERRERSEYYGKELPRARAERRNLGKGLSPEEIEGVKRKEIETREDPRGGLIARPGDFQDLRSRINKKTELLQSLAEKEKNAPAYAKAYYLSVAKKQKALLDKLKKQLERKEALHRENPPRHDMDDWGDRVRRDVKVGPAGSFDSMDDDDDDPVDDLFRTIDGRPSKKKEDDSWEKAISRYEKGESPVKTPKKKKKKKSLLDKPDSAKLKALKAALERPGLDDEKKKKIKEKISELSRELKESGVTLSIKNMKALLEKKINDKDFSILEMLIGADNSKKIIHAKKKTKSWEEANPEKKKDFYPKLESLIRGK